MERGEEIQWAFSGNLVGFPLNTQPAMVSFKGEFSEKSMATELPLGQFFSQFAAEDFSDVRLWQFLSELDEFWNLVSGESLAAVFDDFFFA